MGRYCLYCFTPLPRDDDACARCGRRSPDALRRSYWSLHHQHVAYEQAAKLVIGALSLLGALAMITRATGPHAGWLFALPLIAGAALWATASKLTRHDPHFRPVLVWTAAFVLLGLAALAVDWRWSVACAGAAVLVVLACRAGQAWKRRRIRGEG